MALCILLVGGVLIGLVGVSIDDKKTAQGAPPAGAGTAAHAQSQGGHAQAQAQPTAASTAVDPKLATEFVQWWLGSALDYSRPKAATNRKAATEWLEASIVEHYQNAFWQPQMVQGIDSGQIVAAFQPVSIQPVAVNPDGSVVVSVKGTFVQQVNGAHPEQKVILADLLVRKDPEGLRIGGLVVNKYAVVQPAVQPAMAHSTGFGGTTY